MMSRPNPDNANESPERLFYQGRCDEVIAATVDDPDSNWTVESVPYVIGSLCFLGRVEEAELRTTKLLPNLSLEHKAACHFFLSIGWVRSNLYGKARKHIFESIKLMRKGGGEANCAAMIRFYARQGLAFYHTASSRHALALHSAERALESSIQADHFFARMLATDLIGHVRVEIGEIARGLQDLELAHRLAQKLGHGSYAKAIYKAIIGYRAHYGLIPDDVIHALNEVIQESKVEDVYTDNYMILELVRQLTLRGRLSEAEQWLDTVSRSIYAKRARQQRIHMNLRWAEIAYQRGNLALLREKLETSAADIDAEADRGALLRWQGLVIKSKLDGMHVSHEEHRRCTEQVGAGIARRIYAREHKTTHPLAQGDDPLGDLLDLVSREDGFRVEMVQRIVQSGYLGLLRSILPKSQQPHVIYLNLLPRSLIIDRQGDIFACDTGSSTKIHDLLKALSRGLRTKEELVSAIWGYEYNPLRHDSLLYTLISRLRTLLGVCAEWLENEDEGYQLRNDVQIVFKEITSREPTNEEVEARIEEISDSQLNMRQLAILEHLKKNKKWLVPEDCVDLFQTSKVTATRDLSHLVKQGLVLRVGKGRATRYGLAEFTQ